MFAKIIAFIKAHILPKKTIASVMAPLTRIQSDLAAVHATALVDVEAAHAAVDRAVSAVEGHYETIDAAVQHLSTLSAILAPPSPQAQQVANLTGSTVNVVAPKV